MEKKELRANIKDLKKQHTKEQLLEQSGKILAKLEQHPDFMKAEKVMFTVPCRTKCKPKLSSKNGT